MKTRIIYPSMWESDEVVELSKNAKILLLNLLTTPSLGLSRYLKHGNNKAMFETGLRFAELEKAQEELQVCGVKYIDGWYFLGCDFAYLDYDGNEKVMVAKEKEISQIPQSAIDYFNGLTTGLKPNINHKSKTINQKSNNNIYNLTLSTVEIKELQDKFPTKTVLQEYEKAQNYLAYTTKKYKDLKRFFINWLHNSKDTRTPPPKPIQPTPELSEEKRAENKKIIKGLNADIGRTPWDTPNTQN